MYRQISLLIICSQLTLAIAPAQQPAGQARPEPLTFHESIRKSVGFLTVKYLRAGKLESISGTCFFVSYDDKRISEDFTFTYLVTNRHMADPGSDQGKHYPVKETIVRLNLRDPDGNGVAGIDEKIPLGSSLQWIFPTRDSVDLAILPLTIPFDRRKYDYLTIPVKLFATRAKIESNRVVPGDKVTFTGYFYQFPGQKKIQPIVREGMLAMMPDEDLETTLRKQGHLYLADVHVFGGNSGSPVFVNVGGMRDTVNVAGSSYLFLGVVSGYYLENTRLKLTIATTLEGTVAGNSGIAMIVPSDELMTILDSPISQRDRDGFVMMFKAKKPK